MGLFEHWPYTNFHDLNLDWIIKKIPEVFTASAQAVQSAETAVTAKDDASAAKEAAQLSAENAALSEENAGQSAESAQNYAEHIADPVNGIVTQWLNDHPEATTTVQDGAITTPKLADGAVTRAKIDPNLDLGVQDNSVTTVKLADHAVTMDKTDFYYEESVAFTASWYTTASDANGHINTLKIADADLASAIEGFPDKLSLVAKGGQTATNWNNGSTRFGIRDSSWAWRYIAVTKTASTINVNGQDYRVLTVTKEDFLTAYNSYINSEYYANAREKSGFSMAMTDYNVSSLADSAVVIAGDVTAELIESNFSITIMSEDFAEAVRYALESGGGVSDDEEAAKEALSGKVMICLGDSYTSGMGSLLSAIASKYEMILDNRGMVSSTICGSPASIGNKGYYPMWERADNIVSDYTTGHTIDGTAYTADDVGIITFMGGANDGFGIETWIGTGIHETDTETIYGACGHIFNTLANSFPNAKLICITQPSSYNRSTSTITDDATAQTLGFENLSELRQMTDIQFSNYAMAQKEKAVYDTAWAYGIPTIDMFHNMPTIFNSSNRSTYWNTDKLHLTSAGYKLISNALDKKIVETVVNN